MKIKTDNKWKTFRRRKEVPERVLKSKFDHLDAENSFDGFVFYRRVWYHLTDFMACGKDSPFPGWESYTSDSFFSGVLIQISLDGERYKIATYVS